VVIDEKKAINRLQMQRGLRSQPFPTAGKGAGIASQRGFWVIKDRFIAEFGSQSGQ